MINMIERQDEFHLEIKNKFKKKEPIRLGAAILAANLVIIYFLIQLFTLIDIMFWFLLMIVEIAFIFLGISAINQNIRFLKYVINMFEKSCM